MEDLIFTFYFMSALIVGVVIGDGLWRIFRTHYPRR